MNYPFSSRFRHSALCSAAGLLLAQPAAGLDLRVSQIEAVAGAGRYLPDVADPSFTGVAIAGRSGTAPGASLHATEVGEWMYGEDMRTITGVTRVDAYRADHWLRDGFLRVGDPAGRPPRIETNPLQLHAWVGWLNDADDGATAVESVRRFDYAIDRDGFVAVVALDNGDREPLPELFAHASNAITVGRADGRHSRGRTRFDGAGRARPDIVGPLPSTSGNVPIVASAAAMLLQGIDREPGLSDAAWPGVIKALLMAGAAPVAGAAGHDEAVFGAGLVDPIRSFRALSAGRPADGETRMQPMGWTLLAGNGGVVTMACTVPRTMRLENWTMVAVTQRRFDDAAVAGGAWAVTPEVPGVAVSLRSLASGALVDVSRQPGATVQRLAPRDLDAGAYEVTITHDPGARVAVAWMSDPGPAQP